MSTYAWIIDRDYITDKTTPEGTLCNAPGVTGPRDAPGELLVKLIAGEGHNFRLYDDDGNLYYTGRYVGDPTSEEAFGPLEDFGTPNAGAVRIDYEQEDGSWETL